MGHSTLSRCSNDPCTNKLTQQGRYVFTFTHGRRRRGPGGWKHIWRRSVMMRRGAVVRWGAVMRGAMWRGALMREVVVMMRGAVIRRRGAVERRTYIKNK